MNISSENKVVLFIRHGDVVQDNDQNLSEIGVKQAITTAEYLIDKLVQESYDIIKIISSPEPSSMESVIPFIKMLKDNSINYSFRIVSTSYEYRRSSKSDIICEFNGKKYNVKTDKTWENFIKRVDTTKKYLEKELKAGDKQLIIFYGHPVFFSSLFTNFVNQGNIYPKHYGQICIHLPNCSISSTGLDIDTNKWDIFSLANTNHLGEEKTGTHSNF